MTKEKQTMSQQEKSIIVFTEIPNRVELDFCIIRSTLCHHSESKDGPRCLRPGIFQYELRFGRFCAEHAEEYINQAAWDIADVWKNIEAACRLLASMGRPVPQIPITATLLEEYEPSPIGPFDDFFYRLSGGEAQLGDDEEAEALEAQPQAAE